MQGCCHSRYCSPPQPHRALNITIFSEYRTGRPHPFQWPLRKTSPNRLVGGGLRWIGHTNGTRELNWPARPLSRPRLTALVYIRMRREERIHGLGATTRGGERIIAHVHVSGREACGSWGLLVGFIAVVANQTRLSPKTNSSTKDPEQL